MRYKNLLYIALSTLTCVFLAFPASAQHNNNNNGGGGGARPATGGSSSSSARPSGGGGVGVRPSGGNMGVSRGPAYNGGQRNNGVGNVGGATQRRGPVYVDRQGNVLRGNNYTPRTGVTPQRGNYGLSPRVGVNNPGSRLGVTPRGPTSGGGGAYRTVPQVGGRGGYWGNHGYYHYNRGYYKSYYAPRLGFSIGVLPYGYYPFYYGDFQYYYSDGLYYQYDNNQYTVVEPPVGAEITTLPEKAQSIMINGQQYYELNGVYYQPVTKDDGTQVYQIAGKDGELNTTSGQDDQQQQGPQMGDIVNQLPQDCRKIKVNGEKLFVSPDGIYYQQQADANGNTTYKIVGLPSEEPEQN